MPEPIEQHSFKTTKSNLSKDHEHLKIVRNDALNHRANHLRKLAEEDE